MKAAAKTAVAMALLLGLAVTQLASRADDEAPTWQPREGRELIGKPAPAWKEGKQWLNSEPLTLEQLRGKVVLIRFWLIGCPYCTSTAPALNDLHQRFGDKGLVVIGFHHPKSPRSRDPEVVQRTARKLGFEFPVGFDQDWEALRAYWFPKDQRRRFTSVSFLIGRRGRIRWLHDGGEYHRGGDAAHSACRAALTSLEHHIQQLLAEPTAEEGDDDQK